MQTSQNRTAQDALTSGAAKAETIRREQTISNPMLSQSRNFEPLLKAPDVARYLSVSRTEAYRLMRSEIPTIRFGSSTVRVRLSDLELFIEKSMVKP
jgi:predicted DNA-binding transcriptional regulator AlpA